jgi:hypothetical protein
MSAQNWTTSTSTIWRALAAGVCLALVLPAGLGSASATAPEPVASAEVQDAAKRKVVFVAGRRSHGYGSHDHWAGSLLLSKWLTDNHPQIEAVVHRDGWPTDPNAFDNAAAIVIYSDGGGGHPAVKHLDQLGAMMKRGVGLVLLHYAVEVQEPRPLASHEHDFDGIRFGEETCRAYRFETHPALLIGRRALQFG